MGDAPPPPLPRGLSRAGHPGLGRTGTEAQRRRAARRVRSGVNRSLFPLCLFGLRRPRRRLQSEPGFSGLLESTGKRGKGGKGGGWGGNGC